MAGTQRGFKADLFREKIRFVFNMAASTDPNSQATFHFAEVVTVDAPSDSEHVPFNPVVTFTKTIPPPIKRPCDIEFIMQGDEPTAFGLVVPAKVKLLLLDLDYADVKNATFVVINGDRYVRHFEQPDFALFDVGLHEMMFIAENEL